MDRLLGGTEHLVDSFRRTRRTVPHLLHNARHVGLEDARDLLDQRLTLFLGLLLKSPGSFQIARPDGVLAEDCQRVCHFTDLVPPAIVRRLRRQIPVRQRHHRFCHIAKRAADDA